MTASTALELDDRLFDEIHDAGDFAPAVPQCVSALCAANEKKEAVQRVKRQLKAGKLRLTDLLEEPPRGTSGMELHYVIASMRGVGKRKVRRLNRVALDHGVNLFAPIGELTPRQRAQTIECLRQISFRGAL